MADKRYNIEMVIGARNKASKALKNVKRGVVALGAATGAAMAASVKAAADFEQQMARVSTMLDKNTMPMMEEFRKETLQMSADFGQSTEALSNGLYDILSAGVDASEAMGVLETASTAATAGFTDTGIAADALTTVLNAYNLEASRASDVSDLLFSIVEEGKTTFRELAPVLGRVAPIANAAGLSMEEMGAALGTMTANGIRTREAVTSLRSVLRAFIKPTTEGKAAAEELGLELNKATLESKGLVGVLKAVNKGTDEQKAAIFGNIRALSGLAPILNNMSAYYEDLSTMQDRAGTTQDKFSKASETTYFQLKQLREQIKNIGVRIGTELLPVVKSVLGQFYEWTQEGDNLETALSGAGDALRFMAKAAIGVYATVKIVIKTLIALKETTLGVFNATRNASKNILEFFNIIKDKGPENVNQIQGIKGAWAEVGDTIQNMRDTLNNVSNFTIAKENEVKTHKKQAELEKKNAVAMRIQQEKSLRLSYKDFTNQWLKQDLQRQKQHEKRVRQLKKTTAKIARHSVDVIASGMQRSLTLMLNGQKNFADGMVGLWQGISNAVVNEIARMTSKLIAFGAVKTALGFTGLGGLMGGVGGLLGFADGVRNFSGGLAVVGERGPELVNLPGGSDVFSNQQSRSMLGGNVTIINKGTLVGTDGMSEFADIVGDEIMNKVKMEKNF